MVLRAVMFIRTVVRLAWRDLRGGPGGMWIVVIGIALGVGMMGAVGSLAESVLQEMRANAEASIGGDVSLRLFHAPAGTEQRAFLEQAATVSEIAELRPSAQAVDGNRRTLVELKAVDRNYPLVGTVELTGAPSLASALARRYGVWGAAVGPELLEALDLSVGDRLRMGAVEVTIRALIEHEPDRAFRGFSLGPRVIVSLGALEESGLAGPGAPVYWYYRLDLPPTVPSQEFLESLTGRFPDAPWRVVDASQGIPGVERTVDLARTLFLLVSLAILLIGGVGVGNAVRSHMVRRLPVIATLKALGAPPRLVFATFLLQAMTVALAAVLLGMAGGALAAAAFSGLAAAWAPDGLVSIQAEPLLLAGLVGLLTAALFALPPLSQAVQAPPPEIWRSPAGLPRRPAGWRLRLWTIGLGAALAGLLAAWTGMPLLAASVAIGAAFLAFIFALFGRLVARVARRLARGRRVALRFALSNLGRPGAPTVPVSVALGVGLMLMVAVAVVGRAAFLHVGATLPEETPALVFLNVAPEDEGDLRLYLSEVQGVRRIETAPFLHARISRLDGAPVTERDVPRSVAWAVRGDRGLSWRAAPVASDAIISGQWWPPDYTGPPLASVDARVASRLGLGVGDTLTLATPAGPVTATVANLRQMDWTALDLDFPVILSPPAEPLPHSVVAAVWAGPDAVRRVEEGVAEAFPEAAAVRTAEVLDALQTVTQRVRTLLLAVSAVALGAAAIVLLGSIASSMLRRRREMLVLHVLGAGRLQLGLAVVLEFVLLAAAVGGVAVILGGVAGAVVARGIADATTGVGLALPVIFFCFALFGMGMVGAALALRLHRARIADELRRG